MVRVSALCSLQSVLKLRGGAHGGGRPLVLRRERAPLDHLDAVKSAVEGGRV